MKHTELSREQIRSQLAALRTRHVKTGDVQLLHTALCLLLLCLPSPRDTVNVGVMF